LSATNVSSYSFPQLDTSVNAERAPADVLAAAWAEADAIRERARAEGEAAGYAAGLERARVEFESTGESLVRALGEAAVDIANARAELAEALTGQAAEVSIAVAEQIIAGAFESQPELVIDVTRGAIRRLSERHRLTVLVNPDDLELIAEQSERLQHEMGGIEFLDVQADRRVERGGAIVQTEYGEIDATIRTQIENARALITAALAGDADLPPDQPGGADAV